MQRKALGVASSTPFDFCLPSEPKSKSGPECRNRGSVRKYFRFHPGDMRSRNFPEIWRRCSDPLRYFAFFISLIKSYSRSRDLSDFFPIRSSDLQHCHYPVIIEENANFRNRELLKKNCLIRTRSQITEIRNEIRSADLVQRNASPESTLDRLADVRLIISPRSLGLYFFDVASFLQCL